MVGAAMAHPLLALRSASYVLDGARGQYRFLLKPFIKNEVPIPRIDMASSIPVVLRTIRWC